MMSLILWGGIGRQPIILLSNNHKKLSITPHKVSLIYDTPKNLDRLMYIPKDANRLFFFFCSLGKE